MNDNIQIVNKNGDIMTVEGISYIEILPSNKKYLFYTLNEKVDNDLTKIYIAEVSDVQGGANPLSDEEWDDIRKKMVKISHKEELSDIKYHTFGGSNYYVGEAKKLAVTAVANQAFKDAQATHTISTNQEETPAVQGSQTFFQADPVPTESETQTDVAPNIFTNPPQPEISQVAQVVEPVSQVEVSEQPGIVTSAQPIEQVESIPVVESSQQTSAPEIVQVQSENTEQKEIISDEDALKAIEVIQDYIAQEEAA